MNLGIRRSLNVHFDGPRRGAFDDEEMAARPRCTPLLRRSTGDHATASRSGELPVRVGGSHVDRQEAVVGFGRLSVPAGPSRSSRGPTTTADTNRQMSIRSLPRGSLPLGATNAPVRGSSPDRIDRRTISGTGRCFPDFRGCETDRPRSNHRPRVDSIRAARGTH